MHKGMLMAIERMRIVNKVNINDIKKIKRLINSIEKDRTFNENNGKISFTCSFDKNGDVRLDCLGFIVNLFNWDLNNRIYRPHSYGRVQFSKYVELARPILELMYDVEGTWELNRNNIHDRQWILTISKNDKKEVDLLDVFNAICSTESTLFSIDDNAKAKYFESMCLKISTECGHRYMNPFTITK